MKSSETSNFCFEGFWINVCGMS